MKYHTPKSENEILPNKLGLTESEKIAEEEYRGFLRAEIKFKTELDDIKKFNWEIISSIHKTAFSHLYEFAGQLRQVNLSKGGFMFPAAKFLPSAVEEFEKEFLSSLPDSFEEYEQLINQVAPLHAELLFYSSIPGGKWTYSKTFCRLYCFKELV
jgi:cell filamentation protein